MSNYQRHVDKITERVSRFTARRTSRRSLLGFIGASLVGATSFPLLPVARAGDGGDYQQPRKADIPDQGDDTSCDYWRYCAIDGYLCSCSGGTVNSCPPGTVMAPVTWIGTCENPVDGKRYVISYNDCCGKTGSGNCLCNTNQGDRPVYVPFKANDINWCLGTESNVYSCSTALVIGLAVD